MFLVARVVACFQGLDGFCIATRLGILRVIGIEDGSRILNAMACASLFKLGLGGQIGHL